jgi:RNA polymerase sigma factor (sigma-70 family)
MKALISKAQQGDETARGELVARLWPRLVSMARHYARCWREDYEDLLGEGWCAVFSALKETDTDIGQPEYFLLERARWRMLDYVKWARRRRADAEDEDHDPPGKADVGAVVLDRVLIAQLAENLSATQRAVLGRLLDGHTWREVAAAIGSSSANVAYHVRQIRKRCGDMVAEPTGTDGREL